MSIVILLYLVTHDTTYTGPKYINFFCEAIKLGFILRLFSSQACEIMVFAK